MYLGYYSDISIAKEIMFEVGKICFPGNYKSYLKDEFVFNSNHRQPVVELKFKYDKLIDKKEYEE